MTTLFRFITDLNHSLPINQNSFLLIETKLLLLLFLSSSISSIQTIKRIFPTEKHKEETTIQNKMKLRNRPSIKIEYRKRILNLTLIYNGLGSKPNRTQTEEG